MFKDLKKGLIIWFGIMLMVLISWITYSALSSLTATTSETLTASKWNALVEHAVPSWFVGSFYLSTCPTGWSEANGTAHTLDLRWTFIRWMNWDANSRDVARTLWDYQIDEFMSHTHKFRFTEHNNPSNYDIIASAVGFKWWSSTMSRTNNVIIDTNDVLTNQWYSTRSSKASLSNASTGGTETRPKNIALLYCVKD
jgi:hypothetical protein